MKVDGVSPSYTPAPASQTNDYPVISADQIKSILYLGLKADNLLQDSRPHTVDKYA